MSFLLCFMLRKRAWGCGEEGWGGGWGGDLVDWVIRRGLDRQKKTTFQIVLNPVAYIPCPACFKSKEE